MTYRDMATLIVQGGFSTKGARAHCRKGDWWEHNGGRVTSFTKWTNQCVVDSEWTKASERFDLQILEPGVGMRGFGTQHAPIKKDSHAWQCRIDEHIGSAAGLRQAERHQLRATRASAQDGLK